MRPIIALIVLYTLISNAAAQSAIKFGYPQTPVGAIAVIADKSVLWTKQGLNVDSVPFASAINTRDAIIGGRIDIGVTGLTNFLVGAVESDMVAFGVAIDQCASTVILARSGSGISHLTDLKG